MKKLFLAVFTALVAILGVSSAAQIAPPVFVPASGLQLSLNTGGYKFFVGEPATAPATTRARVAKLGGLLPTQDGFMASALLANTSRTAIAFNFDDAGAAAVKFKFTVSNAAGELVWQSDTDLVSAQVVTSATLEKGQRWKRALQIPLKVDGAWLKPGVYTLEATVAATPSISAATIFEVANLPEVPTGDSGINGHVVEQGAADSVNALPAPKPLKVYVTVTEKRLPNARYDYPAFTWSGQTDDAGNFTVATPPGVFSVTAFRSFNPVLPLNSGTIQPAVVNPSLILGGQLEFAEVTVAAGKYSEVTLSFPAQPVYTSGIQGQVVSGFNTETASAAARLSLVQPGVPGVLVRITEIQAPGNFYIRGPFTWTVTTDADGKFSQGTPPGNYWVTAIVPGTTTIVPLLNVIGPVPIGGQLGQQVTVLPNAFANVTVYLNRAIVR